MVYTTTKLADPMHTIAKKILEMYVFEKKRPTIQDLALTWHEMANNKYASFVTLSLDGDIVASSWRVHPLKDSTLEELIDNVLIAIDDPRFVQHVKNPELTRKLVYRVDIIVPEYRRLVTNPEEIDVEREWVIVLCQKQGKLGLILSGMLPRVKSGEELYRHAIGKADIDTKNLKRWDVLVYALRTKIYRDA